MMAVETSTVKAYDFTIDVAHPQATINPDMYGIFFEDINFAADGGLYAELIKNRSFEFPNGFTGWVPFGLVTIEKENPCFNRNPNYVRITNDGRLLRAGIDNEGFRGIGLEKGENYDMSFYARTNSEKPIKVSVQIVRPDGSNPLVKSLNVEGDKWQKYSLVLSPTFTDAHNRLRIVVEGRGTVDFDHISLFPQNTWKGRPGGLRRDLAQALYDLNPGVFRFPGGCIIEGNSLATRYQWKNSVGPVENRPLNENRWNYTFKHKAFPDYFQSYGLGFFEYFQLAEDLGAEPLPVISCGLSCQYESKEVVPLDSLQPYVQDALDLIEFANGDTTTTWGKLRAEMGHPAPFNMKYLAVGNEQWGKVYPERLEVFSKAIRAKYPNIQLVGSSGPSASGKDFDYLWPEMKRLGVDLVDEHYYMSPEWFFSNASRYDNYDRKGPKVFAGEYASHHKQSKKANNFIAALSEAAFMTGLERNADVVRLATYAPLFAHIDAWQWNPDMIWYDNLRSMRTPNYYVQQLYSMNPGTDVVPLTLEGKPVAGQDSIYASSTTDSATGEIIVKIVNANDNECNATFHINGLKKRQLCDGVAYVMQNDDLLAENSLDVEMVVPKMSQLPVAGQTLELNLSPRSFTVARIKTKGN
ncbi:MAG: carbohydrate binding domain-containing protein [Muribaculum sp.]|nr:carbohydrate binding domain-containing protein [Muribaculaceae bacterium]MCM1080618.1 carbohydrate binding domain-containing protein [Muribaculum sp.]